MRQAIKERVKRLEKTQEELVKKEETLRLALEAGRMVVWDWDAKSDYMHWWDNKSELVTGRSGGFHGKLKQILKFVEEEDREEIRSALQKVVEKSKRKFDVEFRVVWPDGRVRWMLGKGELAREDGESKRVIGVAMDITEKKMEEKRREHFLGIAGHELKNPLAAIKAYVELLSRKRGKLEDEQVQKYLKRIDVRAEELVGIIDELLDLTRMKQGKMSFVYEEFEFDEFLREIVDEWRLVSRTHSLVRRGSTKSKVVADRARIKQVINNLIKNAIRYSPVGTKVIVKSRFDKKEVEIMVQDFGLGIEKKDQKRIFDLYYRGKEEKKGSKGLGIGLFIAKQIIEQHGGKMRVVSKKNAGSKFYVRLALKPKSQMKTKRIF